MKKQWTIITSLLALFMIFAFAGCGSSDSSGSGDSGDTSSAQQAAGSGCDFDFPADGIWFRFAGRHGDHQRLFLSL